MLPGLERQIQNRQCEKHLREVAGGVDHIAREEGLAGFGGGEVAPEGVHLHEGAVPLLLGYVVVVVLGPFLRRLQLAEELPRISPSLGPGVEICGIVFLVDNAFCVVPLPIASEVNFASHPFFTIF